MLEALRKSLATLERPAKLEAAGTVSFGLETLDLTLGGGMARNALHEVRAAGEADVGAATAFILGIASRIPTRKSIVWIAADKAQARSGALFGSGLLEFGLAPERLLIVTVSECRDLLWAMEEAVHSPAVGAVAGEFHSFAVDAVASRRLSLAAFECGVMTFMLRHSSHTPASTAATRWLVSAASSEPRYGPGPPRINAQLVRNRRGIPGAWMLEWSELDECFVFASTHPQPVASSSVNRPARAAARSVA